MLAASVRTWDLGSRRILRLICVPGKYASREQHLRCMISLHFCRSPTKCDGPGHLSVLRLDFDVPPGNLPGGLSPRCPVQRVLQPIVAPEHFAGHDEAWRTEQAQGQCLLDRGAGCLASRTWLRRSVPRGTSPGGRGDRTRSPGRRFRGPRRSLPGTPSGRRPEPSGGGMVGNARGEEGVARETRGVA